MSDETLLPIHRQLTDKEKYDWAMKSFRELEVKFRHVLAQNEKLISKNNSLAEKLKEWEEETPHNMKGIDKVNAKTYLKLHKSYKSMTDNFWRVNDELRELKKNLQSEKL